MSFHLFGCPEDKLRLKTFGTTSRGNKVTLKIKLETCDPETLVYALQGLAKVRKKQSALEKRAKKPALPAPDNGAAMTDPAIAPAAVASEIRARLGRGEDPYGILAWLTGFMGFRWSQDGEQLRGLGVDRSSNAGARNLLAKWCAAADRRGAHENSTKAKGE